MELLLKTTNSAKMNKTGPIVVIEDDLDDRELLGMVFSELGYENEIKYFSDGLAALDYIQDSNIFPFLILSDINMPRLNGFELKEMIQTNGDLSKKCIPYLFFSTSVGPKVVYEAYTMSAQGFFLKPDRYEDLLITIKSIIEYWKRCYSPNVYELPDMVKSKAS